MVDIEVPLKVLVAILFVDLILSVSTVQAAAPKINVGSLYEYLEADKSTQLKRVRNSGDATAFVRVEISEVVFDGSNAPSERAIENMRLGQGENGLVASPARMIIPAGGQQATRLIYQGGRDEERYYRVRFIPAIPEKLDDFALGEEERSEYANALSAGVSVLAGYGVFLIVHPAVAQYETALQETAQAYTVTNNGNTTVVLEASKSCDPKGENCDAPQKIHLLPKRSKTFNKMPGHTYQFKLAEGGREKSIRFGS